MKDKVCVITGGTDGIGKAAAYGLAVQGVRLLVHGRNPDKGERAVAELKARSGNSAIEFLPADFRSLAEVRRLATAIEERTPRVDVLINNAGSIFVKRRLSEDGAEMTFAVNHLAPFLLTHLLLPALKTSGTGRVVTTASNAYRYHKIPFGDLHLTRDYSPMRAYGISKLANILFTVAAAKRLTGTRVTANCLHPGVIATKLLRAGFGMGGGSVERGARTSVYLATSPEVEGVTAKYFVDGQAATPSRRARDDQLAEVLWEASERTLAAWL